MAPQRCTGPPRTASTRVSESAEHGSSPIPPQPTQQTRRAHVGPATELLCLAVVVRRYHCRSREDAARGRRRGLGSGDTDQVGRQDPAAPRLPAWAAGAGPPAHRAPAATGQGQAAARHEGDTRERGGRCGPERCHRPLLSVRPESSPRAWLVRGRPRRRTIRGAPLCTGRALRPGGPGPPAAPPPPCWRRAPTPTRPSSGAPRYYYY
jgi:hypothetical protein